MFDPVSLAIVVTAAVGSAGVSGAVKRFARRTSDSRITLKSPAGIKVTLDSNEKLTEERVREIASALSSGPGAARGGVVR